MKRSIYILASIVFFCCSFQAFADEKKSPFSTKKQETFKTHGFKTKEDNTNKGNGLPQDPGGGGSGGGGDPIPISGGALLLIGGLLSYTILRKKTKEDA